MKVVRRVLSALRAMRIERNIRKRLLDNGGYMLVELLTAAALSLLLVGTFGYMIVTAGRDQPQIANRSSQVDRGRVALEKITRELREAYLVNGTPTSSQLSVNTFVRSSTCGGTGFLTPNQSAIACRVTFTCTTTACSRTEANTNGTNAGPAVLLVDGLRSFNIFSYGPSATDPAHVTVTLEYPNEDGSESITVSDGAELRNDT
ncbi:MAG: hypothetical protein ACR2OC_04825 [Solirubrobacterales bacterium]